MAEINIPAAPKHLPAAAAKQWTDTYKKALVQAQNNFPEDPGAQRAAATKEANRMLAVPAPKSAADIDALPAWQVLIRGTRKGSEGDEAYCVTADGRKYSFPIVKGK